MNIQIYVLLVVLLLGGLYSVGIHDYSRKKLCVTAITIVMTLFSGLRSWWFGDLIKYYTLYVSCNGPDWRDYANFSEANMGIRFFFHFVGSIGLSYEACIFLIAAFSAITLGIVVYRYSPSPYMSYMIYIAMGFYMFTYSGLKQTMAMGFICLAFCAIVEKKLIWFLICCSLAALFHMPALIFLPAYFVARQKINWFYLFIIVISAALIFVYREKIVEIMNEAYYEGENDFVATRLIGGRLIMMLAILFGGTILRPLRHWDRVYTNVFNLMLVACIIQSFSVYDNVFSRLADYYYQFTVLHIALITEDGDYVAEQYPNYRYEIRYFTRRSIIIMCLAITLFSFVYYRSYISGTVINEFRFLWEIDPYSLYGR